MGTTDAAPKFDPTRIDDGGPAFPTLDGFETPGMSLRDWFAGKALAGICAAGPVVTNVPEGSEQAAIAMFAYRIADAMLKARGGDQ